MVYLLGVASALFYGTGAVMQHREAAGAPKEGSLRLKLLAYLVRRPLWTLAVVSDVVAFVLHAAALGRGPLTLVDPLLTAGLLFALALSAVWERQWLTRREWLGAFALLIGLAVLLRAGAPANGRPTVPIGRWVTAGIVLGIAVGLLVLWGRRAGHSLKPVLLAVAAAIAFAATDALVKVSVEVFQIRGIAAVVTRWYPYALIAVGLLGEVLVQSAFQAGPLALSLPALTAVEPFASGALGVILFSESVRADPVALTVEILAGALTFFGIWVLGRSPTVTGPPGIGPPGVAVVGDVVG